MNEGGLGVRSLINLNVASSLKICWDLMTSQEDWAIQLRSRAFHKHGPIKYHILSSIWSSCKSEVDLASDNNIRTTLFDYLINLLSL